MESLFAKADAIRPIAKRRKITQSTGSRSHREKSSKQEHNETANSIVKHTSLPKSLRSVDSAAQDVPKHAHITNPKLRSELIRQSTHTARTKALLKDAELLLINDAGKMEVDGEMERTWRVGQDEIIKSAGQEAAKGRNEWRLDGGPYSSRYSRNGRYVHLMYSFLLADLIVI